MDGPDTMARYRVVALDEIDPVPGPASLAWRPLRAELGVRAFGLSSFVATHAGDDVIEPHTESEDGRGHQELYFVVRGRARFTLEGEAFDAPAGTFVFVGDPAVHRHAVAAEPGTEVLAFGGDPVFQPSGSEVMWRVRALLPDQVDRSQALVDAALADVPESPGAGTRRRSSPRPTAARTRHANGWRRPWTASRGCWTRRAPSRCSPRRPGPSRPEHARGPRRDR